MSDNESDGLIDIADFDPRIMPMFKTSPERIGLAIGDELEDWNSEFHDCDEVTWYSGEPPVQVSIGYVRADLYESMQSQLAAANERADAEKTRGDWLRRQYNGLHDKYAAAVKSLEDARRQVQFPRQPNGEGGWIIDANYISAIRKDCPVEWQPGEEEIEAVLLAAERAAPVPAQPSALTERWTQAQLDQLNSKASDLFKAATHKPLAEDVPAQPAVVQDAVVRALIEAAQMAVEMIETEKHERRHVRWALKDALLAAKPAVVPKHAADWFHDMREVLFDIATSDVICDRPEHAFVTVAIDRDTLSRAAILSTTDTEVKK